jgi:uncharacterized protein YgbK (DUF1537 family)
MRWLILADDLTGAADCAIAFARRGLDAVVTWGADTRIDSPVLSVDVDSRRHPPVEAVRRQLAAQAARWRPPIRLYKKIDSTLRGQPAAELAAQLQALASAHGRPPLAIVAPAFPAVGRTTLGGQVLVDGAKLETTSPSSREHTYATSSLPEMLASGGLSSLVIDLATVRAGTGEVEKQMADAERRGVHAVVCDCVLDSDLDMVAAASLRLGAAAWVGSAGLAHALAALEGPPECARPTLPPVRGPILTVVGSLAELSRLQGCALADGGLVQPIRVDPATLLAGPTAHEWRMAQGALAEALATGCDALLEITRTADPDLALGPEFAARVARLALPFASHIGALVATGGETACALLSGFGVNGIRLIDEIEPGVPVGLTLGALAIPVVTKAGGFGNPETLCRSLTRLKS